MITKHIITTVGTSFLENYRKASTQRSLTDVYDKDDKWKEAKKKKSDYANSEEGADEIFSKIEILEKNFFKEIHFNQDKWLSDSSITINKQASAEIQTILKIAENLKGKASLDNPNQFGIYLLCTDTYLSCLAAVAIVKFFEVNQADILKEYHCQITFHPENESKYKVIDGLVIYAPTEQPTEENFFDKGFMKLVEEVNGLADTIRKIETKAEIIFNISGGYKAIIPIMTILGQLERISLNYMYEDSNNLVEIGNLPIYFDWSVIEDNYTAFEGIRYQKDDKNKSLLEVFEKEISPEYTIEQLEKEYKLISLFADNNIWKVKETFWGELLHKTYDELYEKGKMVRNNILSNLVELKVYEFFSKKYKCVCGHKINGFDADVFVDMGNNIKVIEVKPASNVPIWENKKKKADLEKRENTIEKNCYEGAFFQAKKVYTNVSIELFIYGHSEPHFRIIEQLLELKNKENNPSKDFKIVWVSLKPNYKTDTEWKVEGRLKLFTTFDKTTKKTIWEDYK